MSGKNIKKKLAKTTNIDIIDKLLDEADDDNIVKLIIVRKTQILIQQKIEQQLKKCKEKLIDLESHYRTISTYLHDNTQLQVQLQLQEILLGYQLGKTREAYSSATAKLQANVIAGNLHKKQGEVEEAVKNVGKELELAAYRVYNILDNILERLEQLKRTSNTHVGKHLLQRGYHLKTRI
jgi:exonuclease VII large subunit